MKKILKAIGLILVLLVIYYVAQTAVGLVLGFVHIVGMGISAAQSGTALNVTQVTEELMRYIASQTSWIILLAVAVTVPSYYLIYRSRRQELLAFISVRSIGIISIPVLIVFGLSLNVVFEILLSLLSQLDVFSGFFDTYDQLADAIFSGSFILSLISVGIIGPIFEELLFRGLVFGELRKISTVKLAIVIQAVLFGVYHMNVVQGSYAFLIGLILGYVCYRSSSIVAPTIIHITINSSTVLLPMLFSETQFEAWSVTMAVAGVILLVATSLFILMNRRFRHPMDNSLYEQNNTPRLDPPFDAGL